MTYKDFEDLPVWQEAAKLYEMRFAEEIAGESSAGSPLAPEGIGYLKGSERLKFQISDLKFQISEVDFRFQISDLRSQISDFRFQISDLGSQISNQGTIAGPALRTGLARLAAYDLTR